jgi:hypothetical protein
MNGQRPRKSMVEKKQESAYRCRCEECKQKPKGKIAKLHIGINQVVNELNEKNRRRFAGLLACERGYGGIQYIARVTGMSRTTILRGQREIEQLDNSLGSRMRAKGAGGKFIEKNSQG